MSHKSIKLIADSGIQFYNFEIVISEDFNRENKINYIEEFNDEKEIIWYEKVIKNKADDAWFRKSELETKAVSYTHLRAHETDS